MLALSYMYSKGGKGEIRVVDADAVAEDFREFAA